MSMCNVTLSHSVRALLSFLFLVFGSNLYALHHLSPRLQIGINLLPAVMAADTSLKSLRGRNLGLTVWIVYQSDRSLAQGAANKLSQVKTVRGLPLSTRLASEEELLNSRLQTGSAVLLVEEAKSLQKLITFSTEQRVLLFSPFKGDVKRGVMSGFEITNKVLPAINISAINRANIHLKAFFLRIAVKHGEQVDK